jgi:preprotein translocase subunit SecE
MSAQRRAGSKRRGSASARRSGTNQRAAQAPAEGTVAPANGQANAVAATATVEAEKPSRLRVPGRPSRPPMPEQAKPSRPPMPEAPKPVSESTNRFTRRFAGIERWYQDMMSEARKIVWPDRETTRNLTIVVIGISVVVGMLLGGIDFLLQAIFEALP